MPSSISSSEYAESYCATREATVERRHVVFLLTAIALTCVIIEMATAVWSHSVSQYSRRVEAQYAEAAGLRPGAEGKSKSLLIVGNSTLNHGVDVRDLRSRVQPGLDAHVLSLDGSMIEDWHFALRELLRKGARPDFLLLMLTPGQVANMAPPPDDVPYYLFGSRDILMLRKAEGFDSTELSNIFFAHYSAFFGRRTALRLVVKSKLFPSFQFLAHRSMARNLTADYGPVPERFRQIKTLCAQNGVNLLFVIPPTHQESDTLGTPIVLAAAQSTGVPAALPVPNAQLGDDKFYDGYHLNSEGQKVFTAALAEFLKKQVRHDL